MHVSGIELGHHYRIGPGRVRDAQPEDSILKPGPGVDRGEPVERLVPLLVGIAITPIYNLLGRYGLLPDKRVVTSR